jgi:hypothetical protein
MVTSSVSAAARPRANRDLTQRPNAELQRSQRAQSQIKAESGSGSESVSQSKHSMSFGTSDWRSTGPPTVEARTTAIQKLP